MIYLPFSAGCFGEGIVATFFPRRGYFGATRRLSYLPRHFSGHRSVFHVFRGETGGQSAERRFGNPAMDSKRIEDSKNGTQVYVLPKCRAPKEFELIYVSINFHVCFYECTACQRKFDEFLTDVPTWISGAVLFSKLYRTGDLSRLLDQFVVRLVSLVTLVLPENGLQNAVFC